MSRLYVEKVKFFSDDKGVAIEKLNAYLALPQQYDVVAVQHIEELYRSGQDVLANNSSGSTYMLTRKSA